MITLHCTRKVLKRFPLETLDEVPTPSTVLGNWYANLLNVGRKRYVLCVSERTFLPVILPARNSEFPSQLGSYAESILAALRIPAVQIQEEVEKMAEYSVATTESRQVLGVMNDFAQMAKHYLPDDDLLGASLWLAESPSKPLDYSSPDRKTCEAFDVPEPPRLRLIQ